MTTTLLQFLILISAMIAACVIGFWVALQHATGRKPHHIKSNKVAQTIEQLRDQTALPKADKSLSQIVSDRDRERVRAWRVSQENHPAA